MKLRLPLFVAEAVPERAASCLPLLAKRGICLAMTRVFDMDDRARLRERFFGETMSVLAHLG